MCSWSGVRGFDAYPQRQSVTESININSLTDHHIWSTIKTLPATLPEPKFRVSRANSLQHSDWNLRPRTLNGGYWGRFWIRSGLDYRGWGLVGPDVAPSTSELDGLVEALVEFSGAPPQFKLPSAKTMLALIENTTQ